MLRTAQMCLLWASEGLCEILFRVATLSAALCPGVWCPRRRCGPPELTRTRRRRAALSSLGAFKLGALRHCWAPCSFFEPDTFTRSCQKDNFPVLRAYRQPCWGFNLPCGCTEAQPASICAVSLPENEIIR